MFRQATWVIALGITGSSGWACRGDDDAPGGSAGSGSGAGFGGENHAGDRGGSGGAAGSESAVGGHSGAANDQCRSHESCGDWGANFGCPATLDDFESICALGGIELRRYESSCDGTLVLAVNGIQTVRYTFDADGKLIGVWAVGDSVGDLGDCDQWGTLCEAVGEPEPGRECEAGGVGGAGGASGVGGVGGA